MSELYNVRRKRGFNFNITFFLIAINVACFLVFNILIYFNPTFINYFALSPLGIINNFYFWTLLTSMFMHAGFAHLFFNMISLFFLGTLVERIIGRKRFIWFYLISGIFAGLFFALSSGFFGYGIGEKIFGNPSVLGVGASGAIFGLVGILTILIPRKKVYLILGPLLAIIIQTILASLFPSSSLLNVLSVFINFYIILSLFSIISFNPKLQKITLHVGMPFWILPIVSIIPLILIGLFIDLPIGNMAHLGGFIVGLIYGIYLKKKYKNKSVYINNYFSRE